MQKRVEHRILRYLLPLMLAMGVAACNGDDTKVVDTPPIGGEQPEQPQPPTPPGPTPGPPSLDPGPWVLDLPRGAALFGEKCQQCHGPSGVGGYGPPLNNTTTCPPCREFSGLWRRIDEFMPFRNPEACDADCSRHIAAWISNGFSTTPSCTVDFRLNSQDAQRFSATLRIFNFRGLAVPSWRLGFTLPPGQTVATASNALAVQAGNQVLIAPFESNTGIGDGGIVEIGLEGTHGGVAIAPRDLRMEASPCFTAAPGAFN